MPRGLTGPGLTALTACVGLSDFRKAGVEVGAFADLDGVAAAAKQLCEGTDVGARGEWATYSPLCEQAARSPRRELTPANWHHRTMEGELTDYERTLALASLWGSRLYAASMLASRTDDTAAQVHFKLVCETYDSVARKLGGDPSKDMYGSMSS